MHVLIVDDTEYMLEFLAHSLSLFDWEVLQAKSGEEALKIYRTEHVKIDVVLSDQVMPGMDGLTLLGKFLEIDQNVPIVMMTSFSSITLATDFMKKGGSGFIEKPITNFDILKLRIEEAVRHSKQQNQLQDVLVEKLAKERLGEIKDSFLSKLGHELRTPFHMIFSFANLAQKSFDNGDMADAKSMLARMNANKDRLMGLLQNIEHMSQLQAGKFVCNLVPGDISVLMQSVIGKMKSTADERNVQLAMSGSCSHLVAFDNLAMSLVLTNLLDNSIRFSPEAGNVEICLEVVENQVRISVADEGPGIPVGEGTSIFEAFVESSQTSTSAKGTGLGLAIVKGIVDLHGGSISAESRIDDSGSIFTVTLPLLGGEET